MEGMTHYSRSEQGKGQEVMSHACGSGQLTFSELKSLNIYTDKSLSNKMFKS